MPIFATVFAGFCFLGLVSAAPAEDVEPYSSKYERMNIDEVLNNKRLVTYYTNCILGKGPCPPEALEFKRILPDAIRTNCIRCTDKQKTVTLRTIKRLMKEYPKIWSQLAAIWDPKGIYIPKFIRTFDVYGLPLPTQAPAVVNVPSSTTTTTAAPFVPIIGNRFGEDDNEVTSSTVKNFAPSPKPTTTTTAKPKPTSKPSTTTLRPTIKTSTPTSTTNKIYYQSTKKPVATGNVNYNRPHTVSLGTNIVGRVGGFVRELGNIGVRVIGTGVQITEKVLKNVQAAVGLQ